MTELLNWIVEHPLSAVLISGTAWFYLITLIEVFRGK